MRMSRHAVMLGALLPGLSCVGTPLPEAKLTTPGGLLFNGYKNPEVTCYRCHNGDGTGTLRGPNLAKRVPDIQDARIQHVIEDGKSIMPAFKGKISPDEIDQIVSWLRSSFPGQPDGGG
jgi:mono/diheme cytochrome c family protein